MAIVVSINIDSNERISDDERDATNDNESVVEDSFEPNNGVSH